MLYPQFVEALCLLATAAAGRLRSLYPDVAGKEPSIGRTHEVDGILADESLGPKAVGYGASRIGNRSTLERDQAPVPMPFVTQGWSGVMKEKTGGKSSELSGSRRTRCVDELIFFRPVWVCRRLVCGWTSACRGAVTVGFSPVVEN